jgi:glucokinase
MKIICFDIGGTKILRGVVAIKKGRYKFLEIDEVKNPRKEREIKEIISAYCREMRKKHWTKRVAISTADIVDPIRKTIHAQKINFGTDYFSLAFLEKEGFFVRVENDGRCFALGEYHFGKGLGKKSVLALTLGTGIGGGCVIEGKNLRGAHSSALEVGRSKIFFSGKLERWEWIAAGRGIEKYYTELGGKKLSTREIFEEVRGKESIAKKVISQAQEVLGVGIAYLLNVLDPELVVFGGSISKQKKFMEKVFLIAKKNCTNKKANYKFAISTLGNKANLLGAVSLYK